VRRLKPSSSFLQCSGYWFHGIDQAPFVNGGLAYQMPTEFGLTDLRGKKIKSTQLPLVRNPLKLREFFANS
jgi:hypothetical protein